MTDGEKQAICHYYKAHDLYQLYRMTVALISGNAVRFMRQQMKMSQRKFGEALGLSFSYISKLENGTQPLGPDLAKKIMEMYDKDNDDRTERNRNEQ